MTEPKQVPSEQINLQEYSLLELFIKQLITLNDIYISVV